MTVKCGFASSKVTFTGSIEPVMTMLQKQMLHKSCNNSTFTKDAGAAGFVTRLSN